jgi:hypothetical protein
MIAGKDDYLQSKTEVCETIGRFAVMSLLYEVSASPKPGAGGQVQPGGPQGHGFL